MAKIADLFIAIGADIGEFNKELKKIGKSVGDFGQQLKKVGGDITKTLTVPLAGFAAVALKSSKEASAAFGAFAGTTQRIMGQLGTEIFRALNLGGLLDSLSSGLQQAADWFSSLSDGVKTTIVTIAALVAGIGPAIFLVGQITTAVAGLAKAFGALGLLAKHPLVLLATGLAAAAVALGIFSFGTAEATTDVRGFASSIEEAGAKVAFAENLLRKFDARQRELTQGLADLKEQLQAVKTDPNFIQGYTEAVKNLEAAIRRTEAELAKMDRAQLEANISTELGAKAQKEYLEALTLSDKQFMLSGNTLERYNAQLQALQELKKKLLPLYDAEDEKLQNLEQGLKSTRGLSVAAEFAKDMREVAATAELGVPGFSSINAELAIQRQRWMDIRVAQGENATGLGEIKARIEELESPTSQLIAHIQEVGITAGEFVIGIFDQISQGIGNTLANVIVFGEDAGEAFKRLGQQILATLISTLIQIGIQRLLTAIIGAVAYAKEAVSGLSTYAALTYAAAFASTAAIPIVGPALAPAAASAALAGMLAGAAAAALSGAAVGAGIGGAGIGVAAAAGGGIFTTPSFAAIAERGRPEIVLNERNVEEFFGGSMGGDGEIHVHVYMDGDRVTEKVLRRMPGKLETYGVRM